MHEGKLYKTLIIVGCATLVGYIVEIITHNTLRLARVKDMGASDELLQETSTIYLIGAAFESPLHITTGLLCLYAAFHLKRQFKPIAENFE